MAYRLSFHPDHPQLQIYLESVLFERTRIAGEDFAWVV